MKKISLYTLLSTGLLWSACQQNPSKNTSTGAIDTGGIQVSSYTVQEEPVRAERSFPGRLVALNETELRSEVGGYITKIWANDGANVQKGQALYEIDKQRYQDAYAQAKAGLKIVEANLEKSKRDLNRYESLKKQDAIAQQILDNAYTDVANAQAQVANAQAQVNTAALNLNRATVRAPFSGMIGISQIRLGALVAAGSTLLNTISANNPMALEVAFDEQSLSSLHQWKQNKTDSLFTLSLPDGSIYAYQGSLSVIDRAVNPATGTINIRITFPNPDGILKAGMSGNLLVKTNDHGTQVVIPTVAVNEQLSNYFVYVIGDSNKVTQRTVELGATFKDKIVIKKGLTTGEKIVVEGLQNPLLREGAKVNTDNNQ